MHGRQTLVADGGAMEPEPIRPPIAIIIPFFQRNPGLLQRAVRSVLAQKGMDNWHIIVVDDSSPVDAAKELAPLEPELEGRLTVVRQRNRGASAARNKALDQLDREQPIVAFLDSDDVWNDGHLKRMCMAFAAGADFYFENYHRYDEPQPRFSRCNLAARPIEGADEKEELYWLDGDFFDVLLNGSPATTSTIAYRHAKAPHLRFRTDLWFCEDIFFWMQMSRIAKKVAFSRTLGVLCGKGVNISEGAWGTLKLAEVFLSHSRYHHLVRSEFTLTPEQNRWTRSMLGGLDVDFWESALAAGIRGEYRSIPLVMKYLAMRPQAATRLPAAVAKALHNKFLKPRPA